MVKLAFMPSTSRRTKVKRRRKSRRGPTTGGSSSPYKAGTKRLKKGWRYPKGGGKPVRAKGR